MRVVAIDPGNQKSAMVIIDGETLRPLEMHILPNEDMRMYIKCIRFGRDDRAAIEMIQSYGMAVGREVFETVVWIGRYYEILLRQMAHYPEYVYRNDEKIHICHDSRAKDTNIRMALIDRFCSHDFKSGKGTKDNPDWFTGFKADMWAAYAVGITYIETKLRKEI